jgi:DNA-binding NarL/FixJ family response regulator
MNHPHEIRLFIVDDHAAIRFALEAWAAQPTLEQSELPSNASLPVSDTTQTPIRVVGTAETGHEALRLIPECRPTVLLIDLQLPDMQGTEVIVNLRQSGWDASTLKVLVMTGLETASVKEILASGANGYISKNESSEAFLSAIRHLARASGEVWLHPTVAKQMLVAERMLNEAGITAAERNVLRLIRLSNEEIGEILGISKGTVKNHIANIFQKLNIADREEAVQFAIRVGLIPRLSRF